MVSVKNCRSIGFQPVWLKQDRKPFHRPGPRSNDNRTKTQQINTKSPAHGSNPLNCDRGAGCGLNPAGGGIKRPALMACWFPLVGCWFQAVARWLQSVGGGGASQALRGSEEVRSPTEEEGARWWRGWGRLCVEPNRLPLLRSCIASMFRSASVFGTNSSLGRLTASSFLRTGNVTE